jgi:hypothetical protein
MPRLRTKIVCTIGPATDDAATRNTTARISPVSARVPLPWTGPSPSSSISKAPSCASATWEQTVSNSRPAKLWSSPTAPSPGIPPMKTMMMAGRPPRPSSTPVCPMRSTPATGF